jgi:hypothetical protein
VLITPIPNLELLKGERTMKKSFAVVMTTLPPLLVLLFCPLLIQTVSAVNQSPILSDGYVSRVDFVNGKEVIAGEPFGDVSDGFIYSVTYYDPDGADVKPTLCVVFIDGVERSLMLEEGSWSNGVYREGVFDFVGFRDEYGIDPAASHSFYFKFSDGVNTVALPSSGSFPGPTVNCQNQPPALSNGYVTPTSGDTSTLFSYYVTYYDPEGVAPTKKHVRIVTNGDHFHPEFHMMDLDDGEAGNGVYKFSLFLSPGSHEYDFEFSDGHCYDILPYRGYYSGPTVVTSPLSNGYVTPTSGDTSTLFSYYVTYYDSAGIAPALKELYIDERMPPETMELDSGSTSNGVYTCTLTLSKGLHEFYFRFGDYEDPVTLPSTAPFLGSFIGPRVYSPDEQIKSEKMLTVPLCRQDAGECWAAASQMILGYYGMYGPPISNRQMAMELGSLEYYETGLPIWKMYDLHTALRSLGRVDVSSVYARGLTFDEIKSDIDNGRPIFLNYGAAPDYLGAEHSVVLVGYVEMADTAQNEVFIQDSSGHSYGPALELDSWESVKSKLCVVESALRTSPKTDKKEVTIHFAEERSSGILRFMASSDVSSAWWTKARKWDGTSSSWVTIPGVPDEKKSEKFRTVDINIDANGAGYYKLILSADTETSWGVNVEKRENVAAKLNIRAQSPVNIIATAPDGSRVGYDPKVGTVNEILGATYSGPGSEPQEIIIPNPVTGIYSVKAFGTSTGQYTMTAESVNSQGSTIDGATWQGNAVQGEQYTETLNLTAGQLTFSYDIAPIKVTPCKRLIGQGRCLDVNVTVENKGEHAGTCNVTAYANTTLIETQQVTLSSKNSTTITFTWNTTGVTYGNYAVIAFVKQVSSEIGKLGGYITVTPLGDLNLDGTVNILDIFIVANAFGSKPEDPNWNSIADLNKDNVVNILDIFAVAWDFGKTV